MLAFFFKLRLVLYLSHPVVYLQAAAFYQFIFYHVCMEESPLMEQSILEPKYISHPGGNKALDYVPHTSATHSLMCIHNP